MTTDAVRAQPFVFLVAPGMNYSASGSLYLDDGDSIIQEAISEIEMRYNHNLLSISSNLTFRFTKACDSLAEVTILGVESVPTGAYWSEGDEGKHEPIWYTCPSEGWKYDAGKRSLTIKVDRKLDGEMKIKFE